MRSPACILLTGVLACGAPAANAQRFIAHRGVAQDFGREDLDASTCTAARMLPPRHGWLENTLPSIEAAFAFGAVQVEIDVHPTADGDFVVFHDWTLDCRTDGHGVTRERTLAYLKGLDVGHGYTADGGVTYPFRGRFVGAMPAWSEVMAAFPGRRFLVNIKGNDPREADLVASYVERHAIDLSRLTFYGGSRPIAALRQRWATVRTMSRATLKSCAWRYVLLGWSGYVPEPCRHSIVFVPLNYQWAAWGWPERFVARMEGVGTDVAIIGPMDSRTEVAGTTAIDDEAQLAQVAKGYAGFITTDRIDRLGPAAKGR